MANYQWYPGHMAKAKRMMQENIKLIDLVIELVDARAPLSSRNPDIDELGRNKARLILLNKSDLADAGKNKLWINYFSEKGFYAVEINSKNGHGIKSIHGVVQEACREKIERDRKRGILNRPVRAMVVGIPNVGKSTFINSFAGKACTKTGNKPGVTKGKQWIRLNKSVELLDTPGILWPKFDDPAVGLHLAMIGSINDEIVYSDELACELIRFMMSAYPGALEKRYELEAVESDAYETLQAICISRRCFLKGETPDMMKAASMVVEDFRSGRLGRISLETPDNIQEEPSEKGATLGK
ncbi:MAG: ribosome biogenesis GTPase YlqF [Roseburia sp.]|nr:ribosome biogenesis GTPase YlqF [Roseburia sp.]